MWVSAILCNFSTLHKLLLKNTTISHKFEVTCNNTMVCSDQLVVNATLFHSIYFRRYYLSFPLWHFFQRAQSNTLFYDNLPQLFSWWLFPSTWQFASLRHKVSTQMNDAHQIQNVGVACYATIPWSNRLFVALTVKLQVYTKKFWHTLERYLKEIDVHKRSM
jgi:hypothetical protein